MTSDLWKSRMVSDLEKERRATYERNKAGGFGVRDFFTYTPFGTRFKFKAGKSRGRGCARCGEHVKVGWVMYQHKGFWLCATCFHIEVWVPVAMRMLKNKKNMGMVHTGPTSEGCPACARGRWEEAVMLVQTSGRSVRGPK